MEIDLAKKYKIGQYEFSLFTILVFLVLIFLIFFQCSKSSVPSTPVELFSEHDEYATVDGSKGSTIYSMLGGTTTAPKEEKPVETNVIAYNFNKN